MYHGTPFKNWEAIQREGLLPAPLPPNVVQLSSSGKGIYIGESALVDGFIEGYLSELSGETKFIKLRVDILDVEKLIPDPQMEDPDQQGTYYAYVYPEHIPPSKVWLEEVVDLG